MVNKTTQENGFALLLAIIISSVVLAIGLTLLSVTLKQLNLSSTGRESEVAFQMANLGMECGRYWRGELAEAFRDPDSSSAALRIDSCGGDSDTPTLPNNTNLPGSGTLSTAVYEFDIMVGTELRCINLEVNMLFPDQSDIVDYNVKRIRTDCRVGDVCTVVVSQGYNRSCADKENSIFAVQRELTAEF